MDARTFLGLESDGTPSGFRLPVVPGITAGGGFLFGGCGLGAAIVALEEITERPVMWATAQYLSYARPGLGRGLSTSPSGPQGRSVTQARAVGRTADTEILTVNAALGSRDPSSPRGSGPRCPTSPAPTSASVRTYRFEHESMATRMEQRLAIGRPLEDLDGTPSSGNCALWARMPEVLDMSGRGAGRPRRLRALRHRPGAGPRRRRQQPRQHVPGGPPRAHRLGAARHPGAGRRTAASATAPSYLWAEDGTLLAIASQSTIVRFWKDQG